MIRFREKVKMGNCVFINELELIHHLPVCILNRITCGAHNYVGAEFASTNSVILNEKDFEITENWNIEAFSDHVLQGNHASQWNSSQPLILVQRLNSSCSNSKNTLFQSVGLGTIVPELNNKYRVNLQRRYCFTQ